MAAIGAICMQVQIIDIDVFPVGNGLGNVDPQKDQGSACIVNIGATWARAKLLMRQKRAASFLGRCNGAFVAGPPTLLSYPPSPGCSPRALSYADPQHGNRFEWYWNRLQCLTASAGMLANFYVIIHDIVQFRT